MDTIDVDRLKNLISKRFDSQAAFAKAVDISWQGLQKIYKTRASRRSTVERFARELKVTPESLYVGSDLVAEPAARYSISSKITYVPIPAQAGFFSGFSDDQAQMTEFSIPEMPEGSYYAFTVNGESMSPTIKSGDIVVCSKLSDRSEIKPNAVHVMFDKTEGVVVKRLVVSDTQVTCISDNPKYPEYQIKASTVKDVYRVRRVITANI